MAIERSPEPAAPSEMPLPVTGLVNTQIAAPDAPSTPDPLLKADAAAPPRDAPPAPDKSRTPWAAAADAGVTVGRDLAKRRRRNRRLLQPFRQNSRPLFLRCSRARTSSQSQRPVVRHGRDHATVAVRAGRRHAGSLRHAADRRRNAGAVRCTATVEPGDVVGIGIHTANALRGYAIGQMVRAARRIRRLRRHPRDAVSGRSARAWRGAQRRQRRRRSRSGRRCSPIASAARRKPSYDGGRIEGDAFSSGALGSAAGEPLHVGIGPDGPRLSEALLVLLGVANRRAEAAAATRARCRARDRRAAAQGLPLRRARRRQLLPGDAGRPRGGRSPRRQAAASRR